MDGSPGAHARLQSSDILSGGALALFSTGMERQVKRVLERVENPGRYNACGWVRAYARCSRGWCVSAERQDGKEPRDSAMQTRVRFADTLCPPVFLHGILHIVTFAQGPALALLHAHWGEGTEGLLSTLR